MTTLAYYHAKIKTHLTNKWVNGLQHLALHRATEYTLIEASSDPVAMILPAKAKWNIVSIVNIAKWATL